MEGKYTVKKKMNSTVYKKKGKESQYKSDILKKQIRDELQKQVGF